MTLFRNVTHLVESPSPCDRWSEWTAAVVDEEAEGQSDCELSKGTLGEYMAELEGSASGLSAAWCPLPGEENCGFRLCPLICPLQLFCDVGE